MRFLLLILPLLLLSCEGDKTVRDDVRKIKSQSLVVSLDKMEKRICVSDTSFNVTNRPKEYTIVVYTGEKSCSSCALKGMYRWDRLLRETGADLKAVFIFAPAKEKMEEFSFTMRTSSPSQPIYIDTANVFLTENPQVPDISALHTFLLDKDNKVLMVGNPIINPEIRKLFWKILKEGK